MNIKFVVPGVVDVCCLVYPGFSSPFPPVALPWIPKGPSDIRESSSSQTLHTDNK